VSLFHEENPEVENLMRLSLNILFLCLRHFLHPVSVYVVGTNKSADYKVSCSF
jgi:hypothetical protein